MLLSLLFAAAIATPAVPGCADVDGWNRGREGEAARGECGTDYVEAHRLGQALHELRRERAELETQALGIPAARQGELRRRQRQIDIDLEAIRGVATTRAWPLDIAPELEP